MEYFNLELTLINTSYFRLIPHGLATCWSKYTASGDQKPLSTSRQKSDLVPTAADLAGHNAMASTP